MKFRFILLLCVLSHVIRPTISGAQWATDGNALCTATGSQSDAAAIADNAGGAIVVWADNRSGNSDIYAQRVNAWGAVQWTPDGVAVRAGTSSQSNPTIVPDGAGGAIICWTHLANNGATDIYAQRVDPSGVNQWSSDGVLICGAQHDQHTLCAVSDGAGGALVAWLDNRDGDFSTADVYARRINASGIAQWTTDGVAVCTAANAQAYPAIVGDGTGGAIIAWSDFRDGVHYGVYARRVDSSGVAQWTADGIVLDANNGYNDQPAITTDGAGGAIVTWYSDIADAPYTDIYAQRINPSGLLQWTPGGFLVCAADWHQTQSQIISDGVGGAIVTWQDNREDGVPLEDDIYAQRVNASGVAQWTPDGVALCTAAGNAFLSRIVPDGGGGAVACWTDTRSGPGYDIYARRINAAGTPLWAADGVPLSTATSLQFIPRVVSDGFGGAIAAWVDYRAGDLPDIYANRVTSAGAIPTPVRDTPPIPSIAGNNYPNPFSNTTAIEIWLNHEAHVDVEIYDVAGRRVRAMNVGRVGAEARTLNFDGRDEHGKLLPSGLYFYRIRAGNATVTRKLVIQR